MKILLIVGLFIFFLNVVKLFIVLIKIRFDLCFCGVRREGGIFFSLVCLFSSFWELKREGEGGMEDELRVIFYYI